MAQPPLLGPLLALFLAAFPAGARAQDWKEALEGAAITLDPSAPPPRTRCDEASAAVEEACQAAHPKCAELRLLFKDAEALEADVDSCLAGLAACGAKVYELYLQRDVLSERYSKLTPDGGLMDLWALLYDQERRLEKVAPRDTVGMATAEVKRLCRTSPPRCPALSSGLSAGVAALTGARACGAAPCGRAALDAANLARRAFFAAVRGCDYSECRHRFALFMEAERAAPQAVAKSLGAEFDALDETVTALEATTDGLKKRSERKEPSAAAKLEALAASGQAALDEFWAVSLSLDRSGFPLKLASSLDVGEDALVAALTAQRKRANGLALRLAALRDELIALQRKRGLKAAARVDLSKLLPKDGAPAPAQLTKGLEGLKDLKLPSGGVFETKVPLGMEESLAVSADGLAGLPIPTPDAGLSAPKKTLLDQTQVPKLPRRRKREAPPPILEGSPCGFWDLWKCLSGRSSSGASQEEVKADALRRLGLTRTIGDPGGTDQLVHKQNANNTCAVVAQQQVLDVFGLAPPGDAAAREKALTDEARAKGFFRDGTSAEYMGNLLQEHGLIVVKHPGASVAELDAALKKGRMLLVGMDAGILWDEWYYLNAGHAILVTGAEVMKGTGKVLGYYVNDSGTGEGGAFVPAARFRGAWKAAGSFFAEVR